MGSTGLASPPRVVPLFSGFVHPENTLVGERETRWKATILGVPLFRDICAPDLSKPISLMAGFHPQKVKDSHQNGGRPFKLNQP